MTPWQIRLSSLASCSLVTLRGTLDATNSSELQKRLITVVDEAEGAVIVDLQWLESCDASAVNAFIFIHRYARDRHLRLELAGARGRVAALFRLLGLERTLGMRADVYEAVCTLQDQRPQALATRARPQPSGTRRPDRPSPPTRSGPAQD